MTRPESLAHFQRYGYISEKLYAHFLYTGIIPLKAIKIGCANSGGFSRAFVITPSCVYSISCMHCNIYICYQLVKTVLHVDLAFTFGIYIKK